MNAIAKFSLNKLVGNREITKKDTQKGLALLTKQAGTRDAVIHALAYAALRHTAEDGNGDSSLLDAVIPALGKSGRPEMFKKWVSSFSPYYYDSTLNRFKKAKKGAQASVAFNLDAAWDRPFFSVAEGKVNDPNAFVDFADITELAIKALGSLVKRIDGGKIDSKGHVDMVNQLKTQLVALKDQVAVIDRNYKQVSTPAKQPVEKVKAEKEPVEA